MSTTARLTLIGLSNYNKDLFSELVLPAGYDKDTFIDSLLLEHGEKSALYSDSDFMQKAIGAWGRKWYLELQRIEEALKAQYDPIYNYDRYEEYSDEENTKNKTTGKANDRQNYSDTITNNNTDTETHDLKTSSTASNTNEHTVSAFDSGSYQPDNKDTGSGSGSGTDTGTLTTAHTGTIKNDRSGTVQDLTQEGTNDTDRTFKHNAHLYGNIGVTTSASMVTEVVEQRMKYNLYGAACRLFANELLIGIY